MITDTVTSINLAEWQMNLCYFANIC